ncbi:MAG: carboxypeptidase M32 [Candidatus Pacebacteria bacterium]|nr:carboxypeptidase M32 [Candidatus Paceibacterota bacterium]
MPTKKTSTVKDLGVNNSKSAGITSSSASLKIQLTELKKRLTDISHLNTALGILYWDQETYMPPKAADSRAENVSYLAGLSHKMFVDLNKDKLLSKLKTALDEKLIKGKDAVIVHHTWRSYEREKKLPEVFVKELSYTTSKAQHIWADARAKNKFELFAPWLSKIVTLKRTEARYVGYDKKNGSPYDALIDTYEPGTTTVEISKILNDLKDFLIPFLKKIQDASKSAVTSDKIKHIKQTKDISIANQFTFNTQIAKTLGFDLEAGKIAESTHPFSTGIHPNDVRFTTRYKTDDFFYAIASTMHEAGHALYEQGLPVEHFGTPLAEAVSLGIHESQSRMWENNIGKTKEFSSWLAKQIQKEFSNNFDSTFLDSQNLYEYVNKVNPSFIRTDADEVAYNLHIVIRFEIEKELIEGSIEVKDVPQIWKSKMKDYLGVDVTTNTLGCLQDVHWSCGLFGYFPTYSLGNLYAAQFWNSLIKENPQAYKQIAKGEFKEILAWLRKNIHTHGRTYSASQLVKKVTGEELNSRYFAEYLEKKYKNIYGI